MRDFKNCACAMELGVHSNKGEDNEIDVMAELVNVQMKTCPIVLPTRMVHCSFLDKCLDWSGQVQRMSLDVLLCMCVSVCVCVCV